MPFYVGKANMLGQFFVDMLAAVTIHRQALIQLLGTGRTVSRVSIKDATTYSENGS